MGLVVPADRSVWLFGSAFFDGPRTADVSAMACIQGRGKYYAKSFLAWREYFDLGFL